MKSTRASAKIGRSAAPKNSRSFLKLRRWMIYFRRWFAGFTRQKPNMTNQKPKGKTPSLIGSSNGRPKRITVERRSECCRCHKDICPGQDCFGIPKASSGFSSIKRYCKECFQNVIAQTYRDLEEIIKL